VRRGNGKEDGVLDPACGEKTWSVVETARHPHQGQHPQDPAGEDRKNADWQNHQESNQEGQAENQGDEEAEEEGCFGSYVEEAGGEEEEEINLEVLKKRKEVIGW